MFTISNGILEVQINSLGAELFSIKKDGIEYLWQGDKTYWGGRAYNLFPICGRLTGGQYDYDGKTYEMNLHGFARKCEYEGTQLSADRVDFCLRADEKSLAAYPFNFELHIEYSLAGNAVITKYVVRNKDDKEMYFALGGHPGFNVPLEKGSFEDYYLEFDDCAPKQLIMSDTCYCTRAQNIPFALDGCKILKLKHDLFDNDAILLTDVSHKVALKSSVDNRSVTVITPAEMKYLGIWHAPKTEAPYCAIEPWTSVPAYDNEVDKLETKRDMFNLAAGGEYELSWQIVID